MSNEKEILERFALGKRGNAFALGCDEARITVYSQQVRALNIAWALQANGLVTADTQVVIVGAGVAGLTAALGLSRSGAAIKILERNEAILTRFSGCTQRYLHPHAYDWPDDKATNGFAGLPFMNWAAGSAEEVAQQLQRAWAVESAGTSNITVQLDVDVERIDLEHNTLRCAGGSLSRVGFDVLIAAVGVGTEYSRAGTPGYWDNDALVQYKPGMVETVLVSGNGDGGLVDFVRANVTDFDHGRLIMSILSSPAAYAISQSVARVEQEAQRHSSFDLDQAYKELDLSQISGFVSRIRTKRSVTLNTSDQNIFRSDTMPLNRILVECLRRNGINHWQGRVKRMRNRGKYFDVSLESGETRRFNSVICRHGAKSDLRPIIPFSPLTRGKHVDDTARHPQWPDGFFEHIRIKARRNEMPIGYAVVPLDEGFGLISVAEAINNSGAVVGWTQLPPRMDYAYFVWEGAGLPPALGTIPGLTQLAATSINSGGDYVIATRGGNGQALLVKSGILTVLPSNGRRAKPYSINERAEIVGWCEDDRGMPAPSIWRDDHLEFLPDLGFGGVALRINDTGCIVGELRISQRGNLAAARWVRGELESYFPSNPYYSARAFRLNANGTAVGYLMQQSQPSDFFYWEIGALPVVVQRGEAYGINDDDWIVGRAGFRGAFLYRRGKTLWLDDLADRSWRIMWPRDLTNDLRIVGVAKRDGVESAVLLVPRFQSS